MNSRRFSPFAAALVATALIAAPVSAKDKEPKPVELSESEIAKLQTHMIDADFDITFRSAIAALTEQGYVNINASKDAGTITAETDAKSKLIYNIFWGFGKKKRTQVASLLLETQPGGATRMDIKMRTIEQKARMGSNYSDGTPVMFGEPYREFKAAFDTALASRQAQAAAAAAAAPAPAAEPAAATEPAAAAPPAPTTAG